MQVSLTTSATRRATVSRSRCESVVASVNRCIASERIRRRSSTVSAALAEELTCAPETRFEATERPPEGTTHPSRLPYRRLAKTPNRSAIPR